MVIFHDFSIEKGTATHFSVSQSPRNYQTWFKMKLLCHIRPFLKPFFGDSPVPCLTGVTLN
jgi:hypothetical protein